MLRILVCDDHPAIRTALRLLAKDAADAATTECASAEDLLDALQGPVHYDLLTLDLHLPGRSGLDVLREVKEMRPELPVLVLSADESEESIAAALQAGASGYLCKTVDERTLRNALKDAIQSRITLPEGFVRQSRRRRSTPDAVGLNLSPRQRDVFHGLLLGMTAKQIAERLNVSEGTVKSHTVVVFRELNVNSRAQVVLEAHRRGIRLGG